MNAVPFDTLKLARKLEASGMTGEMAAGTAAALAEAMGGAEVATKADIADLRAEIVTLRTELKGEINDLRTELKGDINDLRTELKGDINDLRTELKGDISGLRTELKGDISALESRLELKMEVLRRDIVIKFGSMLVIAVGVMLAAMRYLPPHP